MCWKDHACRSHWACELNIELEMKSIRRYHSSLKTIVVCQRSLPTTCQNLDRPNIRIRIRKRDIQHDFQKFLCVVMTHDMAIPVCGHDMATLSTQDIVCKM